MDLSIIIPAYNSEKYLGGCLNSICKQITKGVEVLIINDASTDKSSKIFKKYTKKYNYIKLFSTKKRQGVSYCRNLGIHNASGKYICFLDSDDKFLPESIKNILYNIKNFSINELFVVRSQDLHNNKIDKNEFLKTKKSIIDSIRNFDKFRSTCWNYIVQRKRLYLNNIKFNNAIKVFEDQTFVSRALCSIKEFKIINKPIYARRMDEPDTLSKKTGYMVADSCAKLICEISQIICTKKYLINKQKIEFLISRLNFITEQLIFNILVCNKKEVNKISKYFVKHFFFISKLPFTYRRKYDFLIKKSKVNIRLLNYKSKKVKILKKLFINIKSYKIITFCAGIYGEIILKNFINFGSKISCVVDNNVHYSGKKLCKIEIKNPLYLKKNFKKLSNHKLLICNKSKVAFNKIIKQLTKIGFKRKNIIHIAI